MLPGLLLTAGVGGGLAFPALSVGAMRAVTPAERGLAGGMLPTAQQVGAAVVLAGLATIAAARTSHAGGSLVAGYRTSYLVAAALVAATALVVARTRMDGPSRNYRPKVTRRTTSCCWGRRRPPARRRAGTRW